MATNSQIFPQTLYPADGDVASQPGSPVLTVEGIQHVPVSPTSPTDGQTLVYQSAINSYVPGTVPFNQSILVNSLSVSDDYWVLVNFVDTEVQVNSSYPPNGFPILVNGSAAA